MAHRMLASSRMELLKLLPGCRSYSSTLTGEMFSGRNGKSVRNLSNLYRFSLMMLGSALGKNTMQNATQTNKRNLNSRPDWNSRPDLNSRSDWNSRLDFLLCDLENLVKSVELLPNLWPRLHVDTRRSLSNISDTQNFIWKRIPFQFIVHAEESVVQPSDDDEKSQPNQAKIALLRSELLEEQLLYQQKIFKLEKENQELRRQIMLRQEGRDLKIRKIRRNPVEAYSEILDDMNDLQRNFGRQVTLPQIVIVGDADSGKRSLLEMLMRTRIFPQRDFSLQVPLKLTLSEGPYHLAQFNDTDREFDLENVEDVKELRKELELRLKTASTSTTQQSVSLTIWGPGLSRMIIADLPSLPTNGNAKLASLPEWSREVSLSLLRNPQTIILCLIDSSQDSNYNKTVELVKDFDPDGRRTVYVLTKTDLAETSLANPEKARRIVDGSIFPLKAIGYYSVVCGRGPKDEPLEDVEKFEQIYFSTSKIFQSGAFKPENLTTKELSRGIAQTFWRFVKNSLRTQIDALKTRKSVLEKEWKTRYQKARVLDRDELYESGRMQLLDDVVRLSSIQANSWENELEELLWDSMVDYIFEQIYVPVASGNRSDSRVAGELRLKAWVDGVLPNKSVEVAATALHKRFSAVAGRVRESEDDIYKNFKQTVVDETFKGHKWDSKARENLRSTLANVCEAPYIITPDDWNTSVRFMEQALSDRLSKVQDEFSKLLGPSSFEKWFLFRKQTPDHRNRRAVVETLEKFIAPPGETVLHEPELSKDEANVVLKTLLSQNIKVDQTFVRETWRYIFLSRFLEQALNRITLCGDISETDDLNNQQVLRGSCGDVELFHRVKVLLRTASVTLRNQLMTTEIVRLEGEVKQILDSLERDPTKIKEYFNHPRIELAEELKKISQVQEKLEDLSKLLEDEEPVYRGSSTGDDSS